MIDRLQNLQSAMGPQADQLKEKALDYAATAREQWSLGTDKARNFVNEQPARALGLALGMGVLLGWLIKRR